MTVKKLSDSDKSEILKLYRETGETTSTLADRYGVSNSTISRLLKVTLPEAEYEVLIASKRAARTPHGEATQPILIEADNDAVEQPTIESPSEIRNPPVVRQRKGRTATKEVTQDTTPQQLQLLETLTPEAETPDLPERQLEQVEEDFERPKLVKDVNPAIASTAASDNIASTAASDNNSAETDTIAEMLGEDLLDDDDDESELTDDEDDEDLDDFDDDFDEEPFPLRKPVPVNRSQVQVLPLSEATLPRTCYLVIDRSSELIVRPLRDFGDLGQIPTTETQQKTLPVFDNHRVARRFSTKRDKVIKIPDSRLLQKTRSHLQAKGITRLLVDGQVYSLSLT